MPPRTLAERFWPKVRRERRPRQKLVPGPCWIWTGAVQSAGYGHIYAGALASPLLVHRVAYELAVGPVPEGSELDHLCRTPLCVNPAHLEPVSHVENVRRGVSKNRVKKLCPRGHRYTAANTRVERRPDGGERRHCRACHREGYASAPAPPSRAAARRTESRAA